VVHLSAGSSRVSRAELQIIYCDTDCRASDAQGHAEPSAERLLSDESDRVGRSQRSTVKTVTPVSKPLRLTGTINGGIGNCLRTEIEFSEEAANLLIPAKYEIKRA